MATQKAIKEAGAADLSQHTPSLVRGVVGVLVSWQFLSTYSLIQRLNFFFFLITLELQTGSVLECPDGHGGSLLIRIQNMSCTGE